MAEVASRSDHHDAGGGAGAQPAAQALDGVAGVAEDPGARRRPSSAASVWGTATIGAAGPAGHIRRAPAAPPAPASRCRSCDTAAGIGAPLMRMMDIGPRRSLPVALIGQGAGVADQARRLPASGAGGFGLRDRGRRRRPPRHAAIWRWGGAGGSWVPRAASIRALNCADIGFATGPVEADMIWR